jgi:hypothetical protein
MLTDADCDLGAPAQSAALQPVAGPEPSKCFFDAACDGCRRLLSVLRLPRPRAAATTASVWESSSWRGSGRSSGAADNQHGAKCLIYIDFLSTAGSFAGVACKWTMAVDASTASNGFHPRHIENCAVVCLMQRQHRRAENRLHHTIGRWHTLQVLDIYNVFVPEGFIIQAAWIMKSVFRAQVASVSVAPAANKPGSSSATPALR